MRSGMPLGGRLQAYFATQYLVLQACSTRFKLVRASCKWEESLDTKMAVSMVSDRESEQELADSHLMLKNDCLCFRISSPFVGNNPSLQIHSFSEDRGNCNKTGNASISDFSTILASHIPILAESSHLPSDEAYRQRLSLPCYRLSTPCFECKLNTRHVFDKIFIKAWLCWGLNVSILSHDICTLIRDHDPAYTIHYLWLSLPSRFQAQHSFPSYVLVPGNFLHQNWVGSHHQ